MSPPTLFCAALFLLAAAIVPATCAPFVPESEGQVLEHLPFAANDPAMRELSALRNRLKNEPDNLPLAVRLAQGYLELGRVTGDPRYAGYAQAALVPWWDLKQPPDEILVLRAVLRQRTHQFDAALTDLAEVLNSNPRNTQARLTRAGFAPLTAPWRGPGPDVCCLQSRQRSLLRDAAGLALARRAMWRWP